jgi:hypothetical protein
MKMDMQHGHDHTAWTWACSNMDIDMQHGLGHAAWTWTCSMNLDNDMQHEPGHGMDVNRGMDIDYYWTGMDSGQLYFMRVLEENYQELAKVSGSACQS